MKQVLRIHGRGGLPFELAGALGSASEQAVQCARSAMATHASRRRDPVVNGAWMLPRTATQENFFEQQREGTTARCGTGSVLRVSGSSPKPNESIVRLFQSDRSREYDEFAERCAAFLSEINRESTAEKWPFAEMEESEQDLRKLARWRPKIQARDFFLIGAEISQSPCWRNADVLCEASRRRFTKSRGCGSPPRGGIIPLPWRPSPKSVGLASTVTTLPAPIVTQTKTVKYSA
jgi:hypothetical protein